MAKKKLILPADKKAMLDAGFCAAFGIKPTRYFSAPGRTEIGGNHTDHQRGRVLAAAMNLDTLAAVLPVRCRPLCPLTVWRILRRAATWFWEPAHVMCYPSVPRAAWRWRWSNETLYLY